jgi:hypothetical protein
LFASVGSQGRVDQAALDDLILRLKTAGAAAAALSPPDLALVVYFHHAVFNLI